jgi:hypothetical protein
MAGDNRFTITNTPNFSISEILSKASIDQPRMLVFVLLARLWCCDLREKLIQESIVIDLAQSNELAQSGSSKTFPKTGTRGFRGSDGVSCDQCSSQASSASRF